MSASPNTLAVTLNMLDTVHVDLEEFKTFKHQTCSNLLTQPNGVMQPGKITKIQKIGDF